MPDSILQNNPGLGDAAGVREVLEDWVVAKSRLKAIGNVDMIEKEKFDAMCMMVDKLCKRNQQFKISWGTRRALSGPGFHDHADDAFANDTEKWLRHELKGMESNELLEATQSRGDSNKRWDWNSEPYPRINKMGAAEGGQQDKRKYFACYELKNNGKCGKTNCPYSHDPETWKEYIPRHRRKPQTEGGTPTLPNELQWCS